MQIGNFGKTHSLANEKFGQKILEKAQILQSWIFFKHKNLQNGIVGKTFFFGITKLLAKRKFWQNRNIGITEILANHKTRPKLNFSKIQIKKKSCPNAVFRKTQIWEKRKFWQATTIPKCKWPNIANVTNTQMLKNANVTKTQMSLKECH